MLKLTKEQIKEIQGSSAEQLAQLQASMRDHVESHGGVLKATNAENIAVAGSAVIALGFIFGNATFTPDHPPLGINIFVERLWGIGLSGGISYVAGTIERPQKGERWTVTVQNTPGIVTSSSLQFYNAGRPVGIVAGPGLSGGLGMIAGGEGIWR